MSKPEKVITQKVSLRRRYLKTLEIRVFKNKPKSSMVAKATYMRADW